MKALMKWLLHSAIDASDGKFNQFALFFSHVSMLKWKFSTAFGYALKASWNPCIALTCHMDPVRLDLCVAQKNLDMTGL